MFARKKVYEIGLFLKLISHIEFHKKVKFGLFANEKIEI